MQTAKELALLTGALSYKITEVGNILKYELFYPKGRALVNAAIRDLQLAGYPAYRDFKNKTKVIISMIVNKEKLTLEEDVYGDLAKTYAVGPKDSLQKNIDLSFGKETVWPPEKPKRFKKKTGPKKNKSVDDLFWNEVMKNG